MFQFAVISRLTFWKVSHIRANLCLFCHVVPTDKTLPAFGSKKYCVLFILISGRWVLWKPGRGGACGLCLFMWGWCRALWCTDPVQHPSEQLASGGAGPSVLTACAWSVTVHYAPIRWSEKSNTFLCLSLLCGEKDLTKIIPGTEAVLRPWSPGIEFAWACVQLIG